ncbi:RNA-binding domain-containing protein, partial [Atractiella rhizophila]
NPGNNLHVSGLSSRVDDEDLIEAFSKFGKVTKAQVMRDPQTRDSRGFGFVTMETPEEGDAAVAGMNAVDLKGRVITVEKVSQLRFEMLRLAHCLLIVRQARRGRARTPTPGQYHGPPKR